MVQHGMLRVTDPHAPPPSHASVEALTAVSRHEMKQGHNKGNEGTSSRVTLLCNTSCTYARRRTWYCSDSREATSTPPSNEHTTIFLLTTQDEELPAVIVVSRSNRVRAGAHHSARLNSLHMLSIAAGAPRASSRADELGKCKVIRGLVGRRPRILAVQEAESIVISSSIPLRGNKSWMAMAVCTCRPLPAISRFPAGVRSGVTLRRSIKRIANTLCSARPRANSSCRATARSTSMP